MITQILVTNAFNYNNGALTWKNPKARSVKIGAPAGHKMNHGYLITGFNGEQYLNHRLIWLMFYGYLPENDIDHINGNKADNRIENLREVSRICNCRNSGNSKRNKSGVKGVCWDPKSRKWRAQMRVAGKGIYLGLYHDFDEAVLARLTAEICLNWSNCNSSSPAYLYCKQKKIIHNQYYAIQSQNK